MASRCSGVLDLDQERLFALSASSLVLRLLSFVMDVAAPLRMQATCHDENSDSGCGGRRRPCIEPAQAQPALAALDRKSLLRLSHLQHTKFQVSKRMTQSKAAGYSYSCSQQGQQDDDQSKRRNAAYHRSSDLPRKPREDRCRCTATGTTFQSSM